MTARVSAVLLQILVMYGDIDESFLTKDTFINSINDEEKQKLETRQKEFSKIVRNVRNILHDLERSIKKSSQYEDELSNGSSARGCLRVLTESGCKTDRESKVSYGDGGGAPRSEVNLSDSWSTMSIVCLQYQYDELARKYQDLLRVHEERCREAGCRERGLAASHRRLDATLRELQAAHAVVHKLCSKYLALKRRKDRDLDTIITLPRQKASYEEKIVALEETTANLLALLEASRDALDDVLSEKLAVEHDARRALLMAEENLRLKARIEELAPSTIGWYASVQGD